MAQTSAVWSRNVASARDGAERSQSLMVPSEELDWTGAGQSQFSRSVEPERASGSQKKRKGKQATHPLASKRSFRASTLTTQPSWPPRLATCPLRPPVTPAAAVVAVNARRSNTLMRLSSEPVMSRFEVKERDRIGAAWAARDYED